MKDIEATDEIQVKRKVAEVVVKAVVVRPVRLSLAGGSFRPGVGERISAVLIGCPGHARQEPPGSRFTNTTQVLLTILQLHTTQHYLLHDYRMASTDSNPVSKSGITVDAATGERFIPSSVRADGTKRREIKVRPGYRPPEDIELYKNRAAAAWKNRAQGGVPGAEGLKSDNSNSSNNDNSSNGGGATSAASNKNAKRREAKKKTKAAEGESGSAGGAAAGGRNIAQLDNWRSFASGRGGETKKATEDSAEKPEDPEAEQEKKARNLKKKLRQARELQDKKKEGESLLPEQLDKIIKINELVRQLESLGFDSNGEKNTDGDKGNERSERA